VSGVVEILCVVDLMIALFSIANNIHKESHKRFAIG